MFCVHVFMCVSVGLSVPQCSCGGQKKSRGCHYLLLPCLRQGFFVFGCCIGQGSWPISFWDASVFVLCLTGALGLQTHVCLHVCLSVGSRDLNSGLYVFTHRAGCSAQQQQTPSSSELN